MYQHGVAQVVEGSICMHYYTRHDTDTRRHQIQFRQIKVIVCMYQHGVSQVVKTTICTKIIYEYLILLQNFVKRSGVLAEKLVELYIN